MTSQLLRISSKERQDQKEGFNSTTNFSIKIKECGLPKVAGVTLKQATIRNTFPNVYDANNLFYFYTSVDKPPDISLTLTNPSSVTNLTATLHEVKIPEGHYFVSTDTKLETDPNNLINVVKTAMAAELGLTTADIVLTYDGQNMTLNVVGEWIGIYPDKDALWGSNPFSNVLGINSYMDFETTATTFGNLPSLEGLNSVLVQTSLTKGTLINGKGQFLDMLTVIPLANCPYGTVQQIIGTNVIDTILLESDEAIYNIDVKITDDDGVLLNNEGGDVDIYILLHF